MHSKSASGSTLSLLQQREELGLESTRTFPHPNRLVARAARQQVSARREPDGLALRLVALEHAHALPLSAATAIVSIVPILMVGLASEDADVRVERRGRERRARWRPCDAPYCFCVSRGDGGVQRKRRWR